MSGEVLGLMREQNPALFNDTTEELFGPLQQINSHQDVAAVCATAAASASVPSGHSSTDKAFGGAVKSGGSGVNGGASSAAAVNSGGSGVNSGRSGVNGGASGAAAVDSGGSGVNVGASGAAAVNPSSRAQSPPGFASMRAPWARGGATSAAASAGEQYKMMMISLPL